MLLAVRDFGSPSFLARPLQRRLVCTKNAHKVRKRNGLQFPSLGYALSRPHGFGLARARHGARRCTTISRPVAVALAWLERWGTILLGVMPCSLLTLVPTTRPTHRAHQDTRRRSLPLYVPRFGSADLPETMRSWASGSLLLLLPAVATAFFTGLPHHRGMCVWSGGLFFFFKDDGSRTHMKGG